MTGPTPRNTSVTITVVVCLTIVILAVIGLYAWSAHSGSSSALVLPLVITVIGAATPGIVGLIRTGDVHTSVQDVAANTNGRMSELIATVRSLAEQAAGNAAQPAAAPPSDAQLPAPNATPGAP